MSYDDISKLSDEELYSIIGQINSKNIIPKSFSEYVEHGKKWYRENRSTLKVKVCNSEKIIAISSDENAIGRRAILIAAVSDVIVSVVGLIPVAVVATLIVREGVLSFCKS